MARYVVKRFSGSWHSPKSPVMRKTGWNSWKCAEILRSRDARGAYTSEEMFDYAALDLALAFEASGCEVDVIE